MPLLRLRVGALGLLPYCFPRAFHHPTVWHLLLALGFTSTTCLLPVDRNLPEQTEVDPGENIFFQIWHIYPCFPFMPQVVVYIQLALRCASVGVRFSRGLTILLSWLAWVCCAFGGHPIGCQPALKGVGRVDLVLSFVKHKIQVRP